MSGFAHRFSAKFVGVLAKPGNLHHALSIEGSDSSKQLDELMHGLHQRRWVAAILEISS